MAKCKKLSRTFALGGAIDDENRLYPPSVSGRNPLVRQGAIPRDNLQKDPVKTLTNQVDMGNAIENSNLTMSEKAALGLGTTSADASALRTRTAAQATLRDGLAAQSNPGNESAWVGGGTGNASQPTWSAPGQAIGAGVRDTNKPVADALGSQASGWSDFRKMNNANVASAGGVASQLGFSNTEKRNVNGLAGFADGGKVNADDLMRQMAAKYGTSGAAPAPAEVAPTPVAPAPQPQQQKTLGGIIGVLKGRQAQIDKAAGYANGGKIQGPGTPTSDSIPAQVKQTGEPIKVSTGERIVSAAQEKVLQQIAAGLGYDSLDALLETGTGKPVGPTIKHGMAHAAFGGKVGEDPENPTPAQQYGTKMLSMKDLAATPEQQATYAGAVDSFKQQHGIPQPAPVASQATPSIADGLQERTFQAPSAAAQTRVADDQLGLGVPRGHNPPPASPAMAGTATMGGRTISLPATPTKEEGYVDAQGKPVQKWEQTARYAEALRVNESMKRAADQMERNRYSRDMAADITNQNVKDSARENLARMDHEEGLAQRGQLLEQQGITAGLDQQIKQLSLSGAQQEAKEFAEMNDPKTTPERRSALQNSILARRGKYPDEGKYSMHVVNSVDPATGQPAGQRVVRMQNHTGQVDDVTNGSQLSAGPTLDQYLQQKKAQFPGKYSDEQLKAEYVKRYASK